jgi:hypothetical protein
MRTVHIFWEGTRGFKDLSGRVNPIGGYICIFINKFFNSGVPLAISSKKHLSLTGILAKIWAYSHPSPRFSVAFMNIKIIYILILSGFNSLFFLFKSLQFLLNWSQGNTWRSSSSRIFFQNSGTSRSKATSARSRGQSCKEVGSRRSLNLFKKMSFTLSRSWMLPNNSYFILSLKHA